jgi:hypothetical protein
VTESKVITMTREDTKKGYTSGAGSCKSGTGGGVHREGATERIKMHGRARATPMAAGRDVVGHVVGSEGALSGDRRL